MKVPFARPDLTSREVVAVTQVIEAGELATGAWVDQFEDQFANYVGAPYAVAMGSCTQGFHMVFEALDVRRRAVVTPTNTFTGPAMMARHAGADVILKDSSLGQWQPSAFDFAQARAELPRVYMPVHFGGAPYPIQELYQHAKMDKIKAYIVDDAAHAAGAYYDHQTAVGGHPLATATVFSFYATKPLCTGNGGMVTTHDEGLAKELKSLRLHGLSKDMRARYDGVASDWSYDVERPGWKANMADMAAAMGLVQLDRLGQMQARRREIAKRYNSVFVPLGLASANRPHTTGFDAWHLYPLAFPNEGVRDRMFERLRARGIGTTVHYTPLHKHTAWGLEAANRQFPNADAMFSGALSLPIYSKMTNDQVDYVIESVLAVLKEEADAPGN